MPSVNRRVIVNPPKTFGNASDYTRAIQDERSMLVTTNPKNPNQTPLLRLYRTPIFASFANRFNPFTPSPWPGSGGTAGPAPEPPPSYANFTVPPIIQSGITQSGSNWRAVASSSDGSICMAAPTGGTAGQIWLGERTGTGQTFTITWQELATGTSATWGGVALSANGARRFGTTGTTVRRSIDGAPWESVSLGVSVGAIACSADGTIVATTVSGGFIYISTDSGATGSYVSRASSRGWRDIAMSSDGTKMVACSNETSGVWVSTNSGATWSQILGTGLNDPYGVAMSGDGSTIYVANNGLAKKGVFNGTTWVMSDLATLNSVLWLSVACSQDGQVFMIGSHDVSRLAWSSDGGTTVSITNTITSGLQWWGVAMSSNGTRVLLGAESSATTKPYAGAFY